MLGTVLLSTELLPREQWTPSSQNSLRVKQVNLGGVTQTFIVWTLEPHVELVLTSRSRFSLSTTE